jgi:hypothetical protein
MYVPHSYSDCQWYIFTQLWQIMQKEISVVVAYKRAYHTITNNACSRINVELMLVSRMDYTMRCLL